MNRGKLKNITLIVLLCVNLCFLLLLLLEKREEAQVRDTTRTALTEIYADVGVELSGALELFDDAPRCYSQLRSLETEQNHVDLLLGDIEVTDQGGNIYVYRGSRGQAVFRGTGEFELLMDEGYSDSGDLRRVAVGVLRKLGVSAAGDPAESVEDGSGELSYICTFDGTAIYNCRVTFSFDDGVLRTVTGSRPFDESRADMQTETMNAPTVLIRFLQISKSEGYVFSRIDDLTQGYVMKLGVSGECRLEPVWEVVTDAGEYYINALNGETESLAE